MVRLQASTGDVDGALAAIEPLLAGGGAQDPEAWQIKGDLLLLGKRDAEGALKAYRQAVSVRPDFVPAHNGLMTVLLGQRNLDGAKAELAQLQKVLPNHPQTLYFAGNVALLGKDLDKANEIAQQLLRAAPNNPQVLQLAGAVEFERRSFVQAESHLAKAVQQAPQQDVSRRLLALTYLQTSQPAKALSTLQPMLDRPNPPAMVYALKAQAHLQAGDIDEAEAAFAQAARIDPDDKRSLTALAVGKLLKGNDAGLVELQTLAGADDGTVADLPLITALARKKDYAGALKAIDALEKKQPDKPGAANLRGRVLLAKGDRAGAEKAFAQALKIQPSFFPAAAALAQLALADKRIDDAKVYLEAVLKADPRNVQALIAIAGLKARTGTPSAEIVSMFTEAVQKAPGEAATRLALVNYQLSLKEAKAALASAQQAVAALPDNPDLVDALGRAQAASGDTNQALASFNKLAQLQPGSPVPYLRQADVQWGAKNQDAALQMLKKALSVAPQNLQAQRALVDAHIAMGKPTEALAMASQIRQQRPTLDIGYMIEGGIEASQKRWDRALAVYRDGLKAAPNSTDLASRVHAVLMTSSKREAEAAKHAAAWVKAHPQDAGFLVYLGDRALSRKDLAEAEARYREALKLQPENAIAINNVAWLMATAKKPGAVAMAEKALALLPDRPTILDTLALALASEGQPGKAVETMKKALALDEKNPKLRLNLAKFLIQAGDKAGAQTELNALVELGDKFPQQKEVGDLLKSL